MPYTSPVQERLRRIAANMQFSYYSVCPGCFTPAIFIEAELKAPPRYIVCDGCGKLAPFDPDRLRRYEP